MNKIGLKMPFDGSSKMRQHSQKSFAMQNMTVSVVILGMWLHGSHIGDTYSLGGPDKLKSGKSMCIVFINRKSAKKYLLP